MAIQDSEFFRCVTLKIFAEDFVWQPSKPSKSRCEEGLSHNFPRKYLIVGKRRDDFRSPQIKLAIKTDVTILGTKTSISLRRDHLQVT